jgi:hypothetical protein
MSKIYQVLDLIKTIVLHPLKCFLKALKVVNAETILVLQKLDAVLTKDSVIEAPKPVQNVGNIPTVNIDIPAYKADSAADAAPTISDLAKSI